MNNTWKTASISSIGDLAGYFDDTQQSWPTTLWRGQASEQWGLVPSIDRTPYTQEDRASKLKREGSAIETIRRYATAFSCDGERSAMQDPMTTLAVLRHHGVPTRLLDWSIRPHVALYFACESQPDEDGAVWAIDHEAYKHLGAEQWRRHPENTLDGTGTAEQFDAKLQAFRGEEPNLWIAALVYPAGFARQVAQSGLYMFTSRFGIDHATALADLLPQDRRAKIRIPAPLKPSCLDWLRTRGVERATLFPDVAGAAEAAWLKAFPESRAA